MAHPNRPCICDPSDLLSLKDDKQPAVVGGKSNPGETIAQAKSSVWRNCALIAATVPGKQKVMDVVDADLAVLEKVMIQVDTAPQAQARLLEIARRVAGAEGIDLRGGDFGQAKVISADYGEVSTWRPSAVRLKSFVNFMAGISHEPEMIGLLRSISTL